MLLAGCGGGSGEPSRDVLAARYSDAWTDVGRDVCTQPTEGLFRESCGARFRAIRDDNRASGDRNYIIYFDPAEDDQDRHGWDVAWQFAEEIECGELTREWSQDEPSTEDVDVRCED